MAAATAGTTAMAMDWSPPHGWVTGRPPWIQCLEDRLIDLRSKNLDHRSVGRSSMQCQDTAVEALETSFWTLDRTTFS
eukprot:1831164-Amphidinium_carterae.1